MKRAIFLDRDGVINEDSGYVYRPEDFHFVDGIFDFCHAAQEKGYLLIIVTNQAGIARGFYTEENFQDLTRWMLTKFQEKGIDIAAVYHCPFHPKHGIGIYQQESEDRKPNPGMIFKARDRFDIDLAHSMLIGDKNSDIEAGHAAGIGQMIAFRGRYALKDSPNVVFVESLNDALSVLNVERQQNGPGPDHPCVSVIIPNYNGVLHLEQCVRSVSKQTIQDLEIIIIDDASTDRSVELIKQLQQMDKRIYLHINPKNFGVAKTRNIGCGKARGTYIAFLDCDDIWREDKLQEQLTLLAQTRAELCFTSYRRFAQTPEIGTDYLVPPTISYRTLLRENVIGCSTVLMCADIAKQYPMDGSFSHEDYQLWLRLLREGRLMVGLEKILVYYRSGGRSHNKYKAARDRWDIYRRSEGLSLFRSGLNLMWYFSNAVKKYYGNKRDKIF